MPAKRTETLPQEIGPEGPRSSYSYPEGWKKPGERVLVSYQCEQRTLATIIMMGGYIENGKGHSNWVTNKISRYMGNLEAPARVSQAIMQLEIKGLVVVQRSKKLITAVATNDHAKADEWAMNAIRKLVLSRKQGKAAEPVKAPEDFVPTSSAMRDLGAKTELQRLREAQSSIELVEENNHEFVPPHFVTVTPELEVEAVEFDYGKVADELLVRFMAKINEPTETKGISKSQYDQLKREFNALQKDYEVAKQTVFDQDQKLKTLTAQIDQLEANNKALIKGAQEKSEEVERMRRRLQGLPPVATATEKPNTQPRKEATRNEKLKDRLSPEENAALESLKRMGS